MENVREMIGIYDAGGNEKLRIPVTLVQLFADVLRHTTSRRKTATPRPRALLSIQEFKSTGGNDIVEAIAAVASSDENNDRILDIAWSMLPEWAKSRQAFEKKWKVRIADPKANVSYRFVRGQVNAALGMT